MCFVHVFMSHPGLVAVTTYIHACIRRCYSHPQATIQVIRQVRKRITASFLAFYCCIKKNVNHPSFSRTLMSAASGRAPDSLLAAPAGSQCGSAGWVVVDSSPPEQLGTPPQTSAESSGLPPPPSQTEFWFTDFSLFLGQTEINTFRFFSLWSARKLTSMFVSTGCSTKTHYSTFLKGWQKNTTEIQYSSFLFNHIFTALFIRAGFKV